MESLPPPSRLEQFFTFGGAGRRDQKWKKVVRRLLGEENKQTHIELSQVVAGPIEEKLCSLRDLTDPMPFSPTNLHFAILRRSQSTDHFNPLWNQLSTSLEPEKDQLLVLVPDPQADEEGEPDEVYRSRLHLQSPRFLMTVSTGRWWQSGDWEQYHIGYNISGPAGHAAVWPGLNGKRFSEQAGACQKLLLFLESQLKTEKLREKPRDQQVLLESLRPGVNYKLLRQEAVFKRESPFELTPQEYLSWLKPKDAEHVVRLKEVFAYAASRSGLDLGIVACDESTDPERRWSDPEIELLLYIQGAEENSLQKAVDFLQREPGFSTSVTKRRKSETKLERTLLTITPPENGQPINFVVEELATQWSIRQKISFMRSFMRHDHVHPYFSVLMEPKPEIS